MAHTEFYVQPSGSDLNAGSTTANAAAFTYAGGTFVRSTGVFTVASGNPQTDGVAVGDFASIYTTSGATVATYVARVTARDATTITVSLTAKAGATTSVDEGAGAATCKIGGAWATPGFAIPFVEAVLMNTSSHSCRVNVKVGTYTLTGGIAQTQAGPLTFEAYHTTAGDCMDPAGVGWDQYVTLDANDGSFTVFSTTGGTVFIRGFIVTNNDGGTGTLYGFSLGSNNRNVFYRCKAHHIRHSGFFSSGAVAVWHECEAYACNTSNTSNHAGFYGGGVMRGCYSHHNTGDAALGTYQLSIILDSVISHNGTYGIKSLTSTDVFISGCDIDNNGGGIWGYLTTANTNLYVVNTNITRCGTGITSQIGSYDFTGALFNCGFANNSTDLDADCTARLAQYGTVTYTANTFPWSAPGTVATKTDANTASVTLTAGHNMVSGNFDVYWSGGSRLNVPGTITGNTLSLDGGTGTDFPVATTAVHVLLYGDYNLRSSQAIGTGRGGILQTAGSVTGLVAATVAKPSIGAAQRCGVFPVTAEVKTGTQYGAGGTEFTGTYVGSGGGRVIASA